MLEKYQKKLNPVTIFVLLLLFIGGMLAMRNSASKVASYNEFQEILDLRMGYSVQECKDYLSGLEIEGRAYYANKFFCVDFIYMIIYNTFYFSALMFLLKQVKTKKKLFKMVLLFPLLSFIFDFGENVFIRCMIKSYPNIFSVISQISSIFTILKFMCVYCSVVCICFLVVIMIKQIIQKV